MRAHEILVSADGINPYYSSEHDILKPDRHSGSPVTLRWLNAEKRRRALLAQREQDRLDLVTAMYSSDGGAGDGLEEIELGKALAGLEKSRLENEKARLGVARERLKIRAEECAAQPQRRETDPLMLDRLSLLR